ncbi:hypothetical protein BpHYR1_033040 [Brachionus plicatilis]|uniref:Uncharacterized protein n=1 Tax=Brachionus plicatilis TaxID=10195 RepID=A0A3M7P483_BRAPC|nr:hypothetical protein BpHYR1_033040 [Brachionus plicatilis]
MFCIELIEHKYLASMLNFQKCRKSSKEIYSYYPTQVNTDTFTSNYSENFDINEEIDSIDSEFLKELETLDFILKQNE